MRTPVQATPSRTPPIVPVLPGVPPAAQPQPTGAAGHDSAIALRQVLDGLAQLPDPQRDGAPAVLRAFALAGLAGVPATMTGPPTALTPMSVIHQLAALFSAIEQHPQPGAATPPDAMLPGAVLTRVTGPESSDPLLRAALRQAPAGSEVAMLGLANPERANREPENLESTRPEPAKSDPPRQEPARSETAKHEPAKAEPAKSESVKPEVSRAALPDPASGRSRPEPAVADAPQIPPDPIVDRRASVDPDLAQATLRAVRETVAETVFKPRELADYDVVLPLPAAPGGQPMPGRIALASRGTSGGGRSVWMRVDTELSHLGKVSVRLSGSDAGAVAITVIAERRAAAALEAAASGLNTALCDLGLAAGLRIAVEDAPW